MKVRAAVAATVAVLLLASGCTGDDENRSRRRPADAKTLNTHTAIEGHTTLGPDSIEGYAAWPPPPGRYVVRLLPADGLRSVARSAVFDVVAAYSLRPRV